MVTRAVYTALLGGYERLVEQPSAHGTDVEFVCLTDDPTLTSKTWEIRLVEPRFPADTVRSARRLKVLGAPEVSDYDETLWIDNRVQLLADPARILDDWLSEHDLAVPAHSFRSDVIDEFRAVVDGGYDDSDRVYEQLIHYLRSAPDVIHRRPHWTSLVARRRSEAVAAAMTRWFEEIARYSRRDQLSFDVAIAAVGLPCRTVELDNLGSEIHHWNDTAHLGRSTVKNTMAFRDALAPSLVVERDLRDLVAMRESVLAAAEADRDAAFEQGRDLLNAVVLREQALAVVEADGGPSEVTRVAAEQVRSAQLAAEAAEEERAAAGAALAAAQRELGTLRASLSWRVTRPLRALRRLIAR